MPDYFQYTMSILQFVVLVIAVAGFFISRRKERDAQIQRQSEEQLERAQLREAMCDVKSTLQQYGTRLSAVELIVELMANQHKSNHKQDLGGVL